MADRATFRVNYPEFDKASDALVDAKLAMATRRVDTQVWATLADDGIYYLTAHLLALSPFGMNARMVNKEGGSTYGAQYDELKSTVAKGYGICGDPRRPPTFRVPDDWDC